MLDSDVANPDDRLIVSFYEHKKEPNVGTVFVKIMVPGDDKNIIDTIARDHHKRRFPRQWLHYQMQNDGSNMIGTPLQDWAKARPEDISDFQLTELGILKYQTVEQLATSSDSQLQKVMGGMGLREKARSFLQSKNHKANSSELEEVKAKHEAEMAIMREQLNSLVAKVGNGETPAPKRRGRPPANPEA